MKLKNLMLENLNGGYLRVKMFWDNLTVTDFVGKDGENMTIDADIHQANGEGPENPEEPTMNCEMDGFRIDDEVVVYDRYRFAVAVLGYIKKFSERTNGVQVKLTSTNNNRFPIDSTIWVDIHQIRKKEDPAQDLRKAEEMAQAAKKAEYIRQQAEAEKTFHERLKKLVEDQEKRESFIRERKAYFDGLETRRQFQYTAGLLGGMNDYRLEDLINEVQILKEKVNILLPDLN